MTYQFFLVLNATLHFSKSDHLTSFARMSEHIFFDLDHTIWDFETNAEETLKELYLLHEMGRYTDRSDAEFIAIYSKINDKMWEDYRNHRIDKETLRTKRFNLCFEAMGYPKERIPKDLWLQYIEICPTKTNLIAGAVETLDYLSSKHNLHLITNGFSETQRRKLKHSKLEHYFDSLTISEEVGAKKPESKIFSEALSLSGIKKNEAIYVGDNHDADVVGAINSNWDMYWYNPSDQATHISSPKLRSIKKLTDLKEHF